jgi:hypothetical protein
LPLTEKHAKTGAVRTTRNAADALVNDRRCARNVAARAELTLY